jgi:hypothetical protein
MQGLPRLTLPQQTTRPQRRYPIFSLRNFPLHLDEMEMLEIHHRHLEDYARIVAESSQET